MADIVGVNGERETFRVVGQPNIPGKTSYALATGVAKFGVDYVLPNMLHAKFLRSPYANARVLSVDISRAKALPGVVDIVTWEDEDIKNLKMGAHYGHFSPGEHRPWLDNYVDQEGMEVAVIVVCESEEICEEALSLLEVEWEVLPHIVDILKGKEPDHPVIRPADKDFPIVFYARRIEMPKKGNISYAETTQGDVEEGFKEADHILEYSLKLPAFSAHLPNPPASVAWWTKEPYRGEGDVLHIEGAVQRREETAMMHGVAPNMCVQEGIFQGGKYCDWGMRRSQEVTPLLAKRTGRPVRCAQTREETFDFLMNERYMYMKVGCTNDGLITAIDDYSVADGGVENSSWFGSAGDQGYGPYYTMKCLNIRQRMDIIDSNRGKMYLSGQHCPFNWDSGSMAIYLIAEKLGKDPIDIARINLHGPDSQEDMRPVPSFDKCLDAGKKLMNWDWHKSGAKTLPDGRKHGAAFRYQMSPRHAGSDYTCMLEYRNGKVYLPTQGTIFGVYAVECNAMVVAEELGIEYDDVEIDYDYRAEFTPKGGGADGTTASAWVTKECANELKKQILEVVISEAETPPMASFRDPPGLNYGHECFKGYKVEDLDIVDGRIVVSADHSIGVPFKEATRRSLVAKSFGRPPMALWSLGRGKMLDTMNTAYCEVAVDTETGEVEILRFGVVADPGKILRPTSLESQVDQVMYFSQGCQLLEDFIYDERTGARLNNNMVEYKKPTMLDVAPVEREFIETRDGNAAYGSNGISHALANTHLVIIAIHNAIGVWVDPPATPDRILKALGKA